MNKKDIINKCLCVVEVEGGDFRGLPDQFEPVASSLTHLVRNMVDHGIEAPAERERRGKDSRGVVRIRLGRASGTVTIVVSDDGQGVDFAAIEERARSNGLIAAGERPERGRLLALMFEGGISTAETVTAVSGRGIGLDAVRRAVQDAGGTITVETKRGLGTTFRISIPEKEAE